MRVPAVVVLAAALLISGAAGAHGIGMSQLRLRIAGAHVDGEWEVSLHDARAALGLDPRITGEEGWRDLREQHQAPLRAYAARRLAFTADGADCSIEIAPAPMTWQSGPSQVVLPIRAACPAEPSRLDMRCDLLFDVDPKHRAYVSVEDGRITHLGLFRSEARALTVDVHHFHPLAGFLEFVREGIWHIWTGFDHILFLLALLLPSPLLRAGTAWVPRGGMRSVTREVVKVVSAFTLAHSATLCLSFFGVVAPPSRWVEVGIALSVFAAAWNNLRPFLPGRAWVVALLFGLVHGLGFAGALRNLALPIRARGLALAAFNVGVELGQLAIVALVLPLIYAASKRRAYPRLVLGAGSLAIAWLAALWIIERGFGLPLLARS